VAGPAGAGGRIQRDDDADHDHVADHGDDAGEYGCHEQLADRFLGQDGVDHQRHRGRDHDAQCAAGRQRAGGQRAGIAIAFEFRQCHLAHGRRSGQRGAADGAEAGAGADGGNGDAALEVAEEGRDEAEQGLRQSAVGGELAHQQEQGYDDQVVVGKSRVGKVLQRVEQRQAVADQEPIAAGADHEHGDADRNAHHQQCHQDAEHDEADLHAAHGLPFAAMRSWWTNM
jgi:hypothetical protein